MPAIIHRMHRLKSLLKIRIGPGAALLPPDVTRIHMEFAKYAWGGHMGPKKFWREHLPRLKYWNPTVPMIVNRTNESGPATMTLYFRDSISDTPPAKDGPETVSSMDGLAKAPEPAEGERTVTIDMKAQLSGDILKEFMEKTGAVPVMPTPQEDAEIRDLEDLHRRGEIDRERMRRTLEAERREAALVAAARNEAASLKSST